MPFPSAKDPEHAAARSLSLYSVGQVAKRVMGQVTGHVATGSGPGLFLASPFLRTEDALVLITPLLNGHMGGEGLRHRISVF